ncbi:unnamed protein product, partial [Didymodactylos carnosus]
ITFRSNESSPTSPFKWGTPKIRKRKATERDSIDEYIASKHQAVESSSLPSNPSILYILRPRKQMEQLDDNSSYSSNSSEDNSSNLPTPVLIRNTNSNKEENDLIITYWKLKNNISDHAVNKLHKIHTSIPSIWSIGNVRKRLNNNIYVNNTEFGSYIALEDAIKTLIYTNASTKTKIRRNITIRLSIDGTQIGEKLKVLVLCISCTQFNSKQQIASKLLPIGLFKIDIEDYETVKKVIPNEIISSKIQGQKLIINGEQFSIKFKNSDKRRYGYKNEPIFGTRFRERQPNYLYLQTLKTDSIGWVKEFSGIFADAYITPYMHVISDHMHEFQELDEDDELACFNLQGAENVPLIAEDRVKSVVQCFNRKNNEKENHEVCTEKLNMAPQMGGIGEVVQIDESLFRGKRKYNRGRLLLGNQNNNGNNNTTTPYASGSEDRDGTQQQTNNRNYGRRMDGPWIFGIAQPTKDGHEVRFFHVQRRNRQTLVQIIWKHVVPGTTVWSDEWAAYKNLQTQYGYDHQTVNYSQNFVDPHTGNTKWIWGTPAVMLPYYL